MKILQINVFNYRRGGAETVYLNTSQYLRDLGHDVINFTLKWEENYPSKYEKYFPESKGTRKGIFRQINNAFNYFYHIEAAKKIEQLIIDERPEIAQIHLIWGQISPSILPVLKRYNIPVIFTIHDYRIVCPAYTFRSRKGEICEKCGNGAFYNCFLNNCTKGNYIYSAMMGMEQYFRNAFFNPAKYADGILYVSNFAKNIHEKYMPALKEKTSIVLYNVSDHIFDTKEVNGNDKYFLFFGRLSKEKGITSLIETFKDLPDIKLKIVGTGPEESTLKKLVASYGANNIEFLGYKTGKDLHKVIREAYFTLVPSEWYENNPLTIIESYSAWIPVIGSRIGGIPEIIEDGKTGYIFEARNVEQLRNCIIKANNLSKEEYAQFCKNTNDFALTYFNPEKYSASLVNLYKQILKKQF